jgi:amidohydrolase
MNARPNAVLSRGTDEILAGYQGIQADQEAFCKDLHSHPELSHAEHRTAGRVAGKLRDYGLTVQTGIGGTGVTGVLANGSGPTVLLRAELDALPVREDTGADYASTVTVRAADGREVPVAHACGHDMHMSCMLGMAKLLADHPGQWNGTLVTLFQPAEETGDGAQAMVDDGLFKRIPRPDVALAQHLLPGIAGTVSTRSGPFMATEDSINVTVYGKGGHGAMPQHAIDPVVLAAMIIVRLQTIVSRETPPGEVAVVSVGSVHGGTRSNLIPDHAVLQLNLRSYSQQTRERMLASIQRIVRAEGQASSSPRDPDFETVGSFPLTVNDPATTDRVAAAFAAHFGDHALEIDRQTVSEDFSNIPDAAGAPYTYWGMGFTDEKTYRAAEKAGRLQDLPTNHSPKFLPPLQPTLRTGTEALVAAALAWLAKLPRTTPAPADLPLHAAARDGRNLRTVMSARR